jgi:hypothetical protein
MALWTSYSRDRSAGSCLHAQSVNCAQRRRLRCSRMSTVCCLLNLLKNVVTSFRRLLTRPRDEDTAASGTNHLFAANKSACGCFELSNMSWQCVMDSAELVNACSSRFASFPPVQLQTPRNRKHLLATTQGAPQMFTISLPALPSPPAVWTWFPRRCLLGQVRERVFGSVLSKA